MLQTIQHHHNIPSGFWHLQLTDEALQDQIVTQMFAGHETTAGVMTRMLQLLKGSPEVLQQLRQEQDSLIDQHGAELTGVLLPLVIRFSVCERSCFACASLLVPSLNHALARSLALSPHKKQQQTAIFGSLVPAHTMEMNETQPATVQNNSLCMRITHREHSPVQASH